MDALHYPFFFLLNFYMITSYVFLQKGYTVLVYLLTYPKIKRFKTSLILVFKYTFKSMWFPFFK